MEKCYLHFDIRPNRLVISWISVLMLVILCLEFTHCEHLSSVSGTRTNSRRNPRISAQPRQGNSRTLNQRSVSRPNTQTSNRVGRRQAASNCVPRLRCRSQVLGQRQTVQNRRRMGQTNNQRRQRPSLRLSSSSQRDPGFSIQAQFGGIRGKLSLGGQRNSRRRTNSSVRQRNGGRNVRQNSRINSRRQNRRSRTQNRAADRQKQNNSRFSALETISNVLPRTIGNFINSLRTNMPSFGLGLGISSSRKRTRTSGTQSKPQPEKTQPVQKPSGNTAIQESMDRVRQSFIQARNAKSANRILQRRPSQNQIPKSIIQVPAPVPTPFVQPQFTQNQQTSNSMPTDPMILQTPALDRGQFVLDQNIGRFTQDGMEPIQLNTENRQHMIGPRGSNDNLAFNPDEIVNNINNQGLIGNGQNIFDQSQVQSSSGQNSIFGTSTAQVQPGGGNSLTNTGLVPSDESNSFFNNGQRDFLTVNQGTFLNNQMPSGINAGSNGVSEPGQNVIPSTLSIRNNLFPDTQLVNNLLPDIHSAGIQNQALQIGPTGANTQGAMGLQGQIIGLQSQDIQNPGLTGLNQPNMMVNQGENTLMNNQMFGSDNIMGTSANQITSQNNQLQVNPTASTLGIHQGQILPSTIQGIQSQILTSNIQGIQGQIPTSNIQGMQGHIPTSNIQGTLSQIPNSNIQGMQGQISPSNMQGIQGQIPSSNIQGMQGQIPTSNIQGIIGQIPSSNTQGMQIQSPTSNIQSMQGQNPISSVQGMQGQILASNIQGMLGQIPSSNIQGMQGQIPSSNIQAMQGQIPSSNIQGMQGQNPTSITHSMQGQNPTSSVQAVVGQNPVANIQGMLSQNPTSNVQGLQRLIPTSSIPGRQSLIPTSNIQGIQGQIPTSNLPGMQGQILNSNVQGQFQGQILKTDIQGVQGQVQMPFGNNQIQGQLQFSNNQQGLTTNVQGQDQMNTHPITFPVQPPVIVGQGPVTASIPGGMQNLVQENIQIQNNQGTDVNAQGQFFNPVTNQGTVHGHQQVISQIIAGQPNEMNQPTQVVNQKTQLVNSHNQNVVGSILGGDNVQKLLPNAQFMPVTTNAPKSTTTKRVVIAIDPNSKGIKIVPDGNGGVKVIHLRHAITPVTPWNDTLNAATTTPSTFTSTTSHPDIKHIKDPELLRKLEATDRINTTDIPEEIESKTAGPSSVEEEGFSTLQPLTEEEMEEKAEGVSQEMTSQEMTINLQTATAPPSSVTSNIADITLDKLTSVISSNSQTNNAFTLVKETLSSNVIQKAPEPGKVNLKEHLIKILKNSISRHPGFELKIISLPKRDVKQVVDLHPR